MRSQMQSVVLAKQRPLDNQNSTNIDPMPWRAYVRLGLGIGQISGVVLALLLLIVQGMTAVTFAVAAGTTALTFISLMLLHDRRTSEISLKD